MLRSRSRGDSQFQSSGLALSTERFLFRRNSMQRVWFSKIVRRQFPPSRSFTVSDLCRGLATMTAAETTAGLGADAVADGPKKLHGRAFYESIGSPKYIVAPMVDQSEFAWRMLTRSFIPAAEQTDVLAYTPMFHARLFSQEEKYRKAHFQAFKPGTSEPWLDGNPSIDRPLFVQFCANDTSALLAAAKEVAPYCDAVDLNLGCPQGIARKGHYGAFLQEDQDLIFRLINTLHKELTIPVTAKIRILETKEKTLEYAKNVLSAGASILTVHGRRREQKGHLTGVADWKMIKFLRDSLPAETVIFANGNILQPSDLQKCLEETGADGVMSAEGNLSNPALFAKPPPIGDEGREYWRGKDGRGGWRVDAVARRYMDILHKYALGVEPPQRRPLFIPGDGAEWVENSEDTDDADEPAKKRRKKEGGKRDEASPNLTAVQPHLFHLLRHFVSKHTDIRDQLARAKKDGIDGYEKVLSAVEKRVSEGLLEYERTEGNSFEEELEQINKQAIEGVPEEESSIGTLKQCKRPWWVVQPIIRPLPSEAMAKGAIQPKKGKEKSGGEVKTSSDAVKEPVATRKDVTKVAEQEEQTKEETASRDELSPVVDVVSITAIPSKWHHRLLGVYSGPGPDSGWRRKTCNGSKSSNQDIDNSDTVAPSAIALKDGEDASGCHWTDDSLQKGDIPAAMPARVKPRAANNGAVTSPGAMIDRAPRISDNAVTGLLIAS
ncbi:tRNA-dihydrouridine(16/17) synthase [Cladobotryum mycophilum]|uniref:tRNA-dihydrouridine(16/17) synthase [NAD(P)(+)] n=1 Tax=Cladobotryum mycophilum TaxID=491253 RepID=A0ABR0SCX3_9HYPO